MDRRDVMKDQLRHLATEIIKSRAVFGEAYYLRRRLREDHRMSLSSDCLRTWMQELANEGHFVRSKYPYGGQGYTWSLPEVKP